MTVLMKNDSPALGIDLGGSKIYAVVTDRENRILARAKSSTEAYSDPEQMVLAMIETGRSAAESAGLSFGKIAHFGAAFPSPVDPVSGDCAFATNLKVKSFSARELFRKHTGKEFYFGNDADLGTLAEYHTDLSVKNLIGYFVGTGLGGGLIFNGRLLRGNMGVAGELGHMIIRKGGRRCGCGHRGCVEAYCSKIAFVKAIQKELSRRAASTLLPEEKFNSSTVNIKSKYLLRAYEGGDVVVRDVIDKGAEMLGVAAASVCAVAAPEKIVLGGGVIASMGKYIFPVFRKSFEKHLFGISPDRIQIALSALGDDCVAVGASILARKRGDI